MDGASIQQLRQKLNLNQVQFAQLLGVHPITVSKWERGEADPTPYQTVLMQHFKKAATDKETREAVGHLLVGMGVGVALALLLKHLNEK